MDITSPFSTSYIDLEITANYTGAGGAVGRVAIRVSGDVGGFRSAGIVMLTKGSTNPIKAIRSCTHAGGLVIQFQMRGTYSTVATALRWFSPSTWTVQQYRDDSALTLTVLDTIDVEKGNYAQIGIDNNFSVAQRIQATAAQIVTLGDKAILTKEAGDSLYNSVGRYVGVTALASGATYTVADVGKLFLRTASAATITIDCTNFLDGQWIDFLCTASGASITATITNASSKGSLVVEYGDRIVRYTYRLSDDTIYTSKSAVQTTKRSISVSFGDSYTTDVDIAFFRFGSDVQPKKYTVPFAGSISIASMDWETAPASEYKIRYKKNGGAWTDYNTATLSAANVYQAPSPEITFVAGDVFEFGCNQSGTSTILLVTFLES